jgi:hypothetical protein
MPKESTNNRKRPSLTCTSKSEARSSDVDISDLLALNTSTTSSMAVMQSISVLSPGKPLSLGHYSCRTPVWLKAKLPQRLALCRTSSIADLTLPSSHNLFYCDLFNFMNQTAQPNPSDATFLEVLRETIAARQDVVLLGSSGMVRFNF